MSEEILELPTATKLTTAEAKRFFPKDLEERMRHPKESVGFFGLRKNDFQEIYGKPYPTQEYYLVANIPTEILIEKGEAVDFITSSSYQIQDEQIQYEHLANNAYATELEGRTPLLVLKIRDMLPQTPTFRVAELMRYADHERYRKRGIASTTLTSIAQAMREFEQTKYIYVNPVDQAWPQKVKPLCSNRLPADIQKDIVSSFDKETLKEGFAFQFGNNKKNFFMHTDPQEHERIYAQITPN